ncbi:MAG: PA14 domain-containing protein [Paludibacter sp.]|nr:PA14 domain-containing protein [Paludibacter sp.]
MQKLLKISFLLCLTSLFALQAQNRIETNLSGKGWKLWYDKNASWKDEVLYLPGTNITSIQTALPTGGWNSLNTATNVSVPGTVEEYLQEKPGPDGDFSGVSWWFRTVHIPNSALTNKLLLRFESARYRSEVFINQKLVGYDLTGNTPFEVDISDYAKPGETVQLALRITDPGGNYDWRDGDVIKWGKYKVPGSHAFGGITGRVKLISCAPVYVNDIYVQNTPAITEVHPQITIVNSSKKEIVRNIVVRVVEKKNPFTEISSQEIKSVRLKPGENLIPVKISAPGAKLWDIENPNLYVCKVSISDGKKTFDEDNKIFGFRWFEPTGQGTDAMFRLNGKRIVLRTAISWGYWPINGIYPTEEMAEKQIRTAKSMGLNMLSFHRCIGFSVVLEKADELGLLYYEEPGNYRSGQNPENPFAHTLMHEKLMRMVKRDRSHPGLVMFNLINEAGPVSNEQLKVHISDILDAHKLDPTRTFTRTSAWCRTEENEQARIHVRPNDTTVYWNGWYDFHHAGGPAVWNQDLYKSPTDYYNYTANKKDIVFFGEEGAISTPPRLEKIKAALNVSPNKGWDGAMYLDWFNSFDSFLNRKNLHSSFPTVDALTVAMGNISIEHQGRKIETIRLDNYTDGYAINGWESEIVENHSGVVDCFRNLKGDTALIAWYNQPLYVAVKVRNQIVETKDKLVTDFYIINEKNLRGVHKLSITVKDPSGKGIFSKEVTTTIAGGDVFGQLIAEGIEIPGTVVGGLHSIDVTLADNSGNVKAIGHEQYLAVDWRSDKINGSGAVWEHNDVLKNFLTKDKDHAVTGYSNGAGPLDWVVVSRPPTGTVLSLVPAEQFVTKDGKHGVTVSFYKDADFQDKIAQRTDNDINLNVPMGATPDHSVTTTEKYNIRWETQIIPVRDGAYFLELQASGFAKLILNGETMINFIKNSGGREKILLNLTKGKPVTVCISMNQIKNADGKCRLQWSAPEVNPADPQKLIDRVASDGTTLIIVENADTWMDLIAKNTKATYSGKFQIGTAWLGGVHFVKQHPLFNGLPTNIGMNWPYQAVVKNGGERYGLEVEGEEFVAGAYHCFPMKIGTAVGIIPCGKGKIIFSTLDICGNLASKESPATVARKLLCNFIEYTGK